MAFTFKSFYDTDNKNSVIESMIIGRSDKRDFIRMNIESEVDIRRPGESTSFQGITEDLSANGVRFKTSTPVKAGEELHVTVKPKNTITPPLEMTVEVIRVDISEDGLSYEAACAVRQPNN